MTLDAAIIHDEEKAKELYSTCELWERLAKERNLIVPSDYEPCKACAEEHEQLAEWLKELKKLRVHMSYIAKEVCNDGFKDNADCFAEIMCRRLVKMGYLELDGDVYKIKE